MDRPHPNLRYVDAKDLEEKATKLRGLEVDSVENEKLGKLEGFIIDVASGRPYHVVVGSGGLFLHKHFLLPIGHVALAPGQNKLVADVTKDRVERFPGFDKDEFKKMSAEELQTLETPTSAACCPGEVVAVEAVAWDASHYTYPTWWQADFYRPDRADMAGKDVAGSSHLDSGSTSPGATSNRPRNESRDRDASREREESRERERVMARGADDARADNGVRAQPGDVLGLDTDGERTYIGDTSEDEDKRRAEADKKAPKQ